MPRRGGLALLLPALALASTAFAPSSSKQPLGEAPSASDGLEAAAAATEHAARPPLQLPWAPDRAIFPSFWFGQNTDAFDTDAYLSGVVGKHALAIYGWSHASQAAPVLRDEAQKLSKQCAALKAKKTGTRCAVYRQGWLAMSNYNEQAAALAGNASSTAGWWQIDNTGEPTPHSGSGVQMLFWDFTNASARQYYQEQVRSLISGPDEGPDGRARPHSLID